MNNKEKVKAFIENLLQERLIFCSVRQKRDLNSKGAMYFIQETETISNELYYCISKSKYYPDGLIRKQDLLEMMIKHSKDNPMMEHHLDMYSVGRYMGHTHCRCCNDSLGNGGGSVIFDYEDKKYGLSLTGGAEHYLKHGINLNLISYSWICEIRKIKLHTQFVGDVKDIHLIEDFIETLEPESKSTLKEEIPNRKRLKL